MPLLTVRRLEAGKYLAVYLKSADGLPLVVTLPVNYWRRGRKRETGGPPPKPFRPRAHAKVRKLRRPEPPKEVG
jgi:hypothetical protein